MTVEQLILRVKMGDDARAEDLICQNVFQSLIVGGGGRGNRFAGQP